MTNLDKHIQDLLYRYDCVIIPSFGGFVGNYKPANYDKYKQLFNPPSKRILFNKNLKDNDGLLANQVAQNENISYDEALKLIQEEVSVFRKVLGEGNRIELERIGWLYHDREENIQFIPDLDTNYLASSFGLKPLMIKPLEEKVPVTEKITEKKKVEQPVKKVEVQIPVLEVVKKEEKVTVEEKKVVVEKPPVPTEEKVEKKIKQLEPTTDTDEEEEKVIIRRSMLRYWPVAAAIAPLVFYSLWIPLRTDFMSSGKLKLSDFNPFKKNVVALDQYEQRKMGHIEIEELANDTYQEYLTEDGNFYRLYDEEGELLVRVKKDKTDVVIEEEKEAAPIVAKHNEALKYHIIGGCFSKMDNAERMVADMRELGYEAAIIDQNKGLHRVKIHSFKSRKEAKKALKEIQSGVNDSAWILKK